ncbi:MAG: LysR family transcriptional regulator [Azospirillaceae bacterium]
MEFRQLRYFVEVATIGSVNRAAARLNIAQPALSRQISRLEADLGVSLFNRRSRGVTLTEPGEKLLLHAEELLQRLARIRDDIAGDQHALEGRIEVGLPPAVSMLLLEGMVQRLGQLQPNLTLHVSEAVSYRLMQWVLAKQVELAIVTNPENSATIRATPLWREGLYLIGAWGDPLLERDRIGVAELSGLPFCLTSRQDTVRKYIEGIFRRHSAKLNVILEMEAMFGVRTIVARGGTYTILPFPAVRADIEAGQLSGARIDGMEISRMLIRRSDMPLTNPARVFIKVLDAEMRNRLSDQSWLTLHDRPLPEE